MIKRHEYGLFYGNSLWGRVLTMSAVLFFVFLGDAILSDWVPSFLQTTLGGSLFMGLVFSFSSVVGLVTDLVFPQLFRKFNARKLVLMAIGANLIFSGILLWTTTWSWLILFLLAMSVWGAYYELLRFGSAQFVSDYVPKESRSGVWAVLTIFKSLAYFIGPIVGSWLAISRGNGAVILTAAGVVCMGYVVWILSNSKERQREQMNEPLERFDMKEELFYWKELLVYVWPVLLISLMLGLIDATYWTTGAVLSENLAVDGFWGGMFLPAFMLPPVFMGLVLARWEIYKRKKKIAEIFLLLAGLFLICLGFGNSIWLLLIFSFLAGAALAVAWPMVDAVSSDILARMGKERKHMVGLSSSTTSMAYIIGPITAGIIASRLGERMTFSAIGLLVVLVATVLLFVTPRKIRLPQSEIATWKD